MKEVAGLPVLELESMPRQMVGVVGEGGVVILDIDSRTLHIFGRKGEYMGASDLEPSPSPDDA